METNREKKQSLKPSVRRELELLDGSIDAGLYLLEKLTPRGVELTQEEIAFVCGCSKGYIYQLEKSAMKKLRQENLRRRLRESI